MSFFIYITTNTISYYTYKAKYTYKCHRKKKRINGNPEKNVMEKQNFNIPTVFFLNNLKEVGEEKKVQLNTKEKKTYIYIYRTKAKKIIDNK
jgi:hypothetical protein